MRNNPQLIFFYIGKCCKKPSAAHAFCKCVLCNFKHVTCHYFIYWRYEYVITFETILYILHEVINYCHVSLNIHHTEKIFQIKL